MKKYLEDKEEYMSTIKIKQVKSRIGAPADQKRTLDALGLHKLSEGTAIFGFVVALLIILFLG